MIGLTQRAMDVFAQRVLPLVPSELVTYTAQARGDATPAVYGQVCAYITGYQARDMQADPMLRTARRARIPLRALAVSPTRNDTLARSDATRWSVEAVHGGAGRPFWDLQLRQVG